MRKNRLEKEISFLKVKNGQNKSKENFSKYLSRICHTADSLNKQNFEIKTILIQILGLF